MEVTFILCFFSTDCNTTQLHFLSSSIGYNGLAELSFNANYFIVLALFYWGFWGFFQYTFLVPTRWMSFMKPIVSKDVSVMVPAK